MGVLPGLGQDAAPAAARLIDGTGYAEQLLSGAPATALEPEPTAVWTSTGVVLGLVSTGLAVAVAAAGLWSRRLGVMRVVVLAMRPLHRIHTGHVGDYVAWLFTGMAALVLLVGIPVL